MLLFNEILEMSFLHYTVMLKNVDVFAITNLRNIVRDDYCHLILAPFLYLLHDFESARLI